MNVSITLPNYTEMKSVQRVRLRRRRMKSKCGKGVRPVTSVAERERELWLWEGEASLKTCKSYQWRRADDRGHKEAMMKAHSAFGGGNGEANDEDGEDMPEVEPHLPALLQTGQSSAALPDGPALIDASTSLLARAGVIEEEDLDSSTRRWMEEAGLMPENFDSTYGLMAPEDAVIIRPYGGEDDDILLQELRPRFVIMYEPNLAFIRRLEVSPSSTTKLMAGIQKL